MKKTFMRLSAVAAAMVAALGVSAEPFRDGDTVVFFGDSITHGGFYHEYVADFYTTRHPDADIRFVNAGIGGDNAKAAQRRVLDDIEPYRPTWVTFHLGMNDIGRGAYGETSDSKALLRREQAQTGYRANMRELIARARAAAPQAKFIYLTTTPYDDTAVVTNMPPDAKGWATVNNIGCNAGLSLMAGFVLASAAEDKVKAVDWYSPLNAFLKRHQKEDPHFMITKWDRVHPEALGHSIMAWEFLLAQGVSPVVSEIAVDAASGKVTRQVNAAVSSLGCDGRAVRFTALEKALPLPVAKETLPYLAELDVERKLNRETLRVTGLAAGDYALLIDGREVGRYAAETFAQGVSLGFNERTPQYVQAQEVFARQAALSARQREIRNYHASRWFYQEKAPVDDIPAFTAWVAKNVKNRTMYFNQGLDGYIDYWPKREQVREELQAKQREIRALARPKAHDYEIRKTN